MHDRDRATRDSIYEQAVSLAALYSVMFGEELRFIGSFCSLVRGLEILPRDLDPLLPRGSSEEFEARVLADLGYIQDENVSWQNQSLDGSVPLSRAVSRISQHAIIGAPPQVWTWDFPEALWQSVRLTEMVSIKIPSQTLYSFLKLKSIADKIWLVHNLDRDTAERKEWLKLLVRDLSLAKTEIFGCTGENLIFDEAVQILDLAGDPVTLAKEIQKAISFVRQTQHLGAAEGQRFEELLQFLSVFVENTQLLSAEPQPQNVTNDPDMIQVRSGAKTVFFNRRTGLVIEGRNGASDTTNVPPAPYFASVQLNAKCNMKCAHCDFEMNGTELPLSVLKDKIDDMRGAGVLQVSFGEAGEALLFEALPDALEYAFKSGLAVNLSTNLSVEPSARLWQAMEAYCSNIAVSVDDFHFPNLAKTGVPAAIGKRLSRLSRSPAVLTINTVYEAGHLHRLQTAVPRILEADCNQISIIRRIMGSMEGNYKPMTLVDFLRLEVIVKQIAERGIDVVFHSTDIVTKLFSVDARLSAGAIHTASSAARETVFLGVDGAYRPAVLAAPETAFAGDLIDAWRSEGFEAFRQQSTGRAL